MSLLCASASDAPAPAAPPVGWIQALTRPAEIRRLVELRLRNGRAGHLRFLSQRLRSKEDAEDVLQEFALKAARGTDRLPHPDKIDAWLSIALRNALFDRYRRNASRARLNEAILSAFPVPTGDSPHQDPDRALECLAEVLDELKPQAAQMLRRAELQEAPLGVIAREMQLTANNVGVRVHRARAALRKNMQARCRACSEPCDLATRWRLAVEATDQSSISIKSPKDPHNWSLNRVSPPSRHVL